MISIKDEDQSVISAIPDSISVSESTPRKRKKSSKSSCRISDSNSIASGDRSSTGSADEDPKWANIFAPCKVMIKMQSRHLSNSKTLITHADPEFLRNFKYDDMDSPLPFPLDNLFGKGSVRRTIHDMEMAILQGKNTFKNINLYTANGTALPCHVVVACINGNRNQGPAAEPKTTSTEPNTTSAFKDRYAVLTIRSAIVIGNAKQHGIGFYGPYKVGDSLSNDGTSVNDRRKRARTSR